MGPTVQPAAIADPQPLTTAESAAPSLKNRWLWRLVHGSPLLVLVWFVSNFSVKIPLLDEWWLIYGFHAVKLRQATFADFFRQHNEHRLLFPKLIWTPLAFATHWNIKAELMLNVLLALIVFAVFYSIAMHQAKSTSHSLLNLAIFSTSLFIFSLLQYETWLLGMMGAVLLVHVAVALAVGVCLVERLHPWIRYSLAAFFCLVASFSMAQGLMAWLALVPCIALAPGRRMLRLSIWGFLFAASVAAYSYHFTFIAVGGDPLGFLYHPLESAGFFLALLGGAFSQSDATVSIPAACLMGSVVFLAFLACLVMLRGYERKEILAPWLAIALFGLLYAALLTVGRSNQGLAAAVQSRYASGTLFVCIATLQLGRLACARRGAQIYTFVLGALWALVILGSMRAIPIAHYLKQDLSHAKLFVDLIRYIDPATDASRESLLFPVYPGEGETGVIRPMAEMMNELNFLPLASNVAFVDQPSADYGWFESADGSGDLQHLRRRRDQVTVSGWAALPRGRGVPKVVMISYGQQKTFITGAVVGWVYRPDIGALRHDPRYAHSGWRVSFPATFLPPGEGILKAWAYDAAEKKFVRLPESGGEKQFEVEAP